MMFQQGEFLSFNFICFTFQERILISDGFKKENRRHHRHLLSIMMTSCDLSDQTKPWEGAFRVSDLLYAEFFNQGDMVNTPLCCESSQMPFSNMYSSLCFSLQTPPELYLLAYLKTYPYFKVPICLGFQA